MKCLEQKMTSGEKMGSPILYNNITFQCEFLGLEPHRELNIRDKIFGTSQVHRCGKTRTCFIPRAFVGVVSGSLCGTLETFRRRVCSGGFPGPFLELSQFYVGATLGLNDESPC